MNRVLWMDFKTFRTLWDEPKGQTKLIHNFLPKFAGQNKSQNKYLQRYKSLLENTAHILLG